MIVNMIKPEHDTVLDPACGSEGLFVQPSHFIEQEGGETAKKVVFFGQEKSRDNINIAKRNLSAKGLEGKIPEKNNEQHSPRNAFGSNKRGEIAV